MLVAIYAIICCGAIGLSFLAYFDHLVASDPTRLRVLRAATIFILIICWYEPISITSNVFSSETGMSAFCFIPVPLGLLGPYFWSTYLLFWRPFDYFDNLYGLSDRMRNRRIRF